jgi:hypothetical protein
MEFEMRRKVVLYGEGKGAWHFVTLPKNISQDLREFFAGMERGFGSLPVEITIGKTVWTTSIFPDKKSGSFMFPLKALVRRKETISAGDTISFILKILM